MEHVVIFAVYLGNLKSNTEAHLLCCKEILWKRLYQAFITVAVTQFCRVYARFSKPCWCKLGNRKNKSGECTTEPFL